MATVEKMTIALTAEQAGFIRSAVRSGRYASTSEVIREAVREWKERRDPLAAYSKDELRELVEAGIESGPGRFHSMAELKAEARRRLQVAQSSRQ